MTIHKIANQRTFEFRLETDIFDYGIAEYIGHSALLIYIALCHRAQKDETFPLVSQLIAECALDKRTIIDAQQLLQKNHLIHITYQQDNKTYAVQSVREAVQHNDWQKLAPADMPLEEIEIPDITPLPYFEQLSNPPPFFDPAYLSPDTHTHQAAPKSTITTATCPYCNERGLIEYVRIHNGKAYYMPCDYNPATIKNEALKRESEIGSAQEGYEKPVDFLKLKKRPSHLIPR